MNQFLEEVRPSRRAVVATGGAAALALALPRAAKAQSAPTWGSKPYAVVERTTYGATEFERAKFDELGWDKYLDWQLRPTQIPDPYCDARMGEYPSLRQTPTQLRKSYKDRGWDVISEVIESQIIRARHTTRQLNEVMTEFWLDHFNVYAYGETPAEMFPEYVAMIRRNALGKFSDLFIAVAHSPAMLCYLDNVDNYKGYGNENYARELMELHAMGPVGGYTERDVKSVMSVLTGWNVEWDEATGRWGTFKFVRDWHDGKAVQFLGDGPANTIPRGWQEQGEAVLAILAAHPSTARNITRKLLNRFLQEPPSKARLDYFSGLFVRCGGDIRIMLKAILREASFKPNAGPKYKEPFHAMISMLRATNGHISEGFKMRWSWLAQARQNPLEWAPPNGYPDAMGAWVDNLRPRWQFAQTFPRNDAWGVYVDLFGQITDRTGDGVVRWLDARLFGNTLPQIRKDQLRSYLGSRPDGWRIREGVGLALASPEFQWC